MVSLQVLNEEPTGYIKVQLERNYLFSRKWRKRNCNCSDVYEDFRMNDSQNIKLFLVWRTVRTKYDGDIGLTQRLMVTWHRRLQELRYSTQDKIRKQMIFKKASDNSPKLTRSLGERIISTRAKVWENVVCTDNEVRAAYLFTVAHTQWRHHLSIAPDRVIRLSCAAGIHKQRGLAA